MLMLGHALRGDLGQGKMWLDCSSWLRDGHLSSWRAK